jgi:cytidine deaminase
LAETVQGHSEAIAMDIPEAVFAELLTAARSAAAKAYCPYSRFKVGAAVLTSEGEVFSGCNVENASYGLTICAERNAVFQAASRGRGPLSIRAVVVYTPTAIPTAPCGACRQVINEFGADSKVISVCDGPLVIESSLGTLLPQAFGPANLAKEGWVR